MALWVGGLEDYSLLAAHLVRRYSSRTNPDYHPAGGFLPGWFPRGHDDELLLALPPDEEA